MSTKIPSPTTISLPSIRNSLRSISRSRPRLRPRYSSSTSPIYYETSDVRTPPPPLHPLRNISSPLLLSAIQRRHARVHDVRFVATQRNTQQIQDRYREKLEQRAREEGHGSVASLKEAYQKKIDELKKRSSTGEKVREAVEAQQQQQQQSLRQVNQEGGGKIDGVKLQQPVPPAPAPTPTETSMLEQQKKQQMKQSSSGAPGIKPLSSYLDMEKVSRLPRKEIEYIWRLRHANDPLSLCAVVPLETYERIYQTAKNHPQFILPLPRPPPDDAASDSTSKSPNERSTAADIHFLQWGFYPPAGPPQTPGIKTANTHTSTVLFTHLAAYKLHGSYAQPHTTVTHHLDLADSHGIVLLNGGVVENSGVSVDEGRWLLMCLQKFYDFEGHGGGIGKEKRKGLLQKFNQGDSGFKVEDLVDEAERIS